jgi:hypothetical protein
MSKLRTGVCLLALIAMGGQVQAAELCDLGSASALKTAAVQQELMVAGLTCNATAQYNNFVIAYRTELQLSDAALMNYFRSRDGNEAGYDTYKTKLANLSASRSAAEGAHYCQAINRDFAAAGHGQTLKDFVAGERLLIAAPEACAVKFDMPDVAVAGPSYALPATPYGAARPQPVNAGRQAAKPEPRRSRADEDWSDGDYAPSYGPSYGRGYGPPPGWLPPPRPARRRDWYGRSASNGYYGD